MAKAKIKVVSAERQFSAQSVDLMRRLVQVLQTHYGLSAVLEITETHDKTKKGLNVVENKLKKVS